MTSLTRPQRAVLELVRAHVAEHGWSPTLREIGAAFGWSSPATARQHLRALQAKGLVEIGAGARSIRVQETLVSRTPPESCEVKNMTKPFFTASDIASMFGVSPATVSRWLAAGRVESVKLPSGRRVVPAAVVERLRGQLSCAMDAGRGGGIPCALSTSGEGNDR